MAVSWDQKLTIAELQAEMYRLQKLLARRDVQKGPLIQDETDDTTLTFPVPDAPNPDGTYPTRREAYKGKEDGDVSTTDFNTIFVNYLNKVSPLSDMSEMATPGVLMEALSVNRDRYLRRNFNPEIQRIGILTSGGDAPGMNAAIRATTLTALNFEFAPQTNMEVYGIHNSYGGLYEWVTGTRKADRFNRERVWNIAPLAGSILRSLRFENWKKFFADGTLRSLKFGNILDGLVVIGGDGSARGARALWKACRFPVVACPGTIDNDTHPWSERSIGFDSAVHMATNMLNSLRSTAEASGRLFFAKLMGRHRGDLPLFAGISGHADFVLTSERGEKKWDHLRLLRLLRLVYKEIKENPYQSALVSVAEGVNLPDSLEAERGKTRSSDDLLVRLAQALSDLHQSNFETEFKNASSPCNPEYKDKVINLWRELETLRKDIHLEIRSMDLGHAQRGGAPVPSDIILASRIGSHAVEVLCTMDWDWAAKKHPEEIPFIGVINDKPQVSWIDPS